MVIIVKNVIPMVIFAEKAAKFGMSIMNAWAIRFVQRLIKNFAAIAAFLFMAFKLSQGGEVFRPFSIAIISRLIGEDAFSLIVIPVFYAMFYSKRKDK